MKQTIIAATAAVLLATAGFGIAAASPRAGEAPRERPSLEDMAENASAYSDAGIAALKAGLRLTPDQEKLWPPVEAALRDVAQQRIDRRMARAEAHRERRAEGRRDEARPELLERMRARADRMSERGDALKALVDAADPLFASLDPGQQRRFDRLLGAIQKGRFAQWDGGRGWKHHGADRPGGHHHGDHRGGGEKRDWRKGPPGHGPAAKPAPDGADERL